MSGRRKNLMPQRSLAQLPMIDKSQLASSSKSRGPQAQVRDNVMADVNLEHAEDSSDGFDDDIAGENRNGTDDSELIRGIMGQMENEDEEGEILDLDPEVEEMLADLEKTDEFGDNVSSVTARTFKSIHQLTVTKDLTDKWKTDLKTPGNCQQVVVPAVNGPIWSGLPMTAKTNDGRLQALQQNMVRAQVAQMRLMDEMLTTVPKDRMPRLLKPLLDAAKCVTAAIQDVNQKRRHQLRPFLRAEYAGLNSSRVPVTNNLYGDDLEKTMKEAKVAANLVRSSSGFLGRHQRYHPFKSNYQNRQSSGNFNRPPQMTGRSGSQFRNNRHQFQRQYQGRPTFNKPAPTLFRRQ